MRKRIFALLTAASMFVCAAPAYVRACETPPNAKGSYETGLSHRNINAQAKVNNGQATDAVMDSISRVDADNDTARDANANLAPGWQRGGSWSTTTTSTTTTTTTPTRPTY